MRKPRRRSSRQMKSNEKRSKAANTIAPDEYWTTFRYSLAKIANTSLAMSRKVHILLPSRLKPQYLALTALCSSGFLAPHHPLLPRSILQRPAIARIPWCRTGRNNPTPSQSRRNPTCHNAARPANDEQHVVWICDERGYKDLSIPHSYLLLALAAVLDFSGVPGDRFHRQEYRG
jgi:hypothetical protein